MVSAPHFLLYTETQSDPAGGRWRFAVRRETGPVVLEAADVEPEIVGPRLELLAAVRGLESFDHPTRVTLVTSSKYVRRGISYGLESWRQNGWTWEWFGQMAPVKNCDLWQRIDRALEFHEVHCRRWRLDVGQSVLAGPHRRRTFQQRGAMASSIATGAGAAATPSRSRAGQRRQLRGRRWLADQAASLSNRIAQLGTGLLPRPWFE